MKKFFVSLLALAATSMTALAQDYAALANPLVGTMSDYNLSTGNTYPAIARPFAMNFWTPQTANNGDGWQYTYGAHKICGFKQTHQPSPWINDHAEFSLFPMTGTPVADAGKRGSWFAHKGEVATPYYYSVYLADYDVFTELAPTDRACIFRFTFPEAQSYICVDAYQRGSGIEIIPSKRMIKGYTTRNSGGVPENFKNYFVIEFDKDFEMTQTYLGTQIEKDKEADNIAEHAGLSAEGFHALAMIGFKTQRGETVHARVASSYISYEQAEFNLRHELGHDSFEQVKEDGHRTWNEILGRIALDRDLVDRRDADAQTFYSCLYRSLLFPMSYWEEDMNTHKPVHCSPHTGEICDGYLYTGTGFWDTFRCLFPLLNLVYPDYSEKMMEGFLNVYRESGFFPEWSSPGHRGCMVGNNSAAVMADAFMKGIRVSDSKLLMEGLMHSKYAVHPTESSTGRLGHEYYNRLGYVPYNVGIKENAARTLEYAYDDWCILQIAKTLNAEAVASGAKKKALPVPAKTIELLNRQALNYRNLYDAESGLMRGRNEDGSFMAPFSPLKWGDAFTEGNAWHYTWSVFHDPAGLAALMGGNEAMAHMLDSVFIVPPLYDDSYYGFPIHEIIEMTVMNTGNYAHGNQPIQHMLYLYDWVGQPWKAQAHLRDVMRRFYTATPDGYCGDEDNGQTSAWYVFSALGFYPVCPGANQYAIGSPLFKNATIHLPAYGNNAAATVNIKAPNNSEKNVYVNAIKRDDINYEMNFINHNDLIQGGTFTFDMSATPNTTRGTSPEAAPYSFSNK